VNLTLKQLRYFLALAETLHFGRAAKLCNVTQPALSMQIKDLEAHLGVTLVERGPTKLLLTWEGQEIAKRAREILMSVQDLTELVSHHRHPLAGRLRLGVIPSIGPYLLPTLLPRVHQAYPDLELSLRESQTQVLVDKLLDGHLDLLVLALPIEPDDIETMPLFDDRFFVALPCVHELASRTEITQDELVDQHLLLLEEGHCLRDQALEVCGLRPGRRLVNYGATSMTTLLQMVEHGMGLTLVPEIAIEAEVSHRKLAIAPFGDPAPARNVTLFSPARAANLSDRAELAEIVRRAAGRVVKPYEAMKNSRQ
jgi:LysR family hydrogen peroxide-inducible transcriptional activator